MPTDLGPLLGGRGKFKAQEFLASGTFTPPKTGAYMVTLVGGGGSGCAARGTSAYLCQGGWSGEQLIRIPVDLTLNVGVTVTIGAGGASRVLAAGSANSSAGIAGGNTSFGSLVAAGGKGGGANVLGDVNFGCVPGAYANPVFGVSGIYAVSSSTGTLTVEFSRGGAGLFGGGGRAFQTSVAAVGYAAPANSGAGGGGAETTSTAQTSTSGVGGSGRVIVEWWE